MEQWHFFLRHRVVLVKQFWSIAGNLGLCGLTINTLVYITLNKKKQSSCLLPPILRLIFVTTV